MERWEGEGEVTAEACDEGEDQWWQLVINVLRGQCICWHKLSLSLSYSTPHPRHTHIQKTYTHTPEMRCPPRPMVGLISGDWREHEGKSRWDVQPLEDWVGEVSERTWVGPWRPGVKTETAATANQGPHVSYSLQQNFIIYKNGKRQTYNCSTKEWLELLWGKIKRNTQSGSVIKSITSWNTNTTVWYLHGARLAVADHGWPSLDVDWLRDRKCLVWLVLREVLQTTLIGLFVLILIGQRTPEGNDWYFIYSISFSYILGTTCTGMYSKNHLTLTKTNTSSSA